MAIKEEGVTFLYNGIIYNVGFTSTSNVRIGFQRNLEEINLDTGTREGTLMSK